MYVTIIYIITTNHRSGNANLDIVWINTHIRFKWLMILGISQLGYNEMN